MHTHVLMYLFFCISVRYYLASIVFMTDRDLEALDAEAAWKSYEPAQKKTVHAIRQAKSGDDGAFKSGDIQ